MRGLVLILLFSLACGGAEARQLSSKELNALSYSGLMKLWAQPAACADKRRTYQETLICQTPQLRHEDLEVYQLFRGVLAGYKGQDHKVFLAGQEYWKFSRADCANPVGADLHNPGETDVKRCMKEKMDQRLVFIKKLKADPGLLQSSVADYKYAAPWYVNLFPKQFEGKEIQTTDLVLSADSPICADPPASLKGRLSDYLSHSMLNARFSGMDTTIRADSVIVEACEAGYNTTNWHGVVKLDGQGKPYLYITEVALAHLPGPK